MILQSALVAMLLQTAPAVPPQSPKATVAGVVVNANGEPIPNIRVALGKLNVNLGAFTAFVTGDRPPRETTISAEAFEAIREEMANEIANGGLPPEELRQISAFTSVSLTDIHEVIVSPTGATVVVPKSSPPIMTDDRGRFAFTAVDPGTYKVMFSGSGYAKQDYGQRTIGAGGVPLTLSPGQSKADIVMRMVAVGAVSGRIRDAAGQPAAGVPVQLFRFTYDDTGKKTVQRVTTARTDDLGDYRMYYLSPGRYYMSAGNPPGQNNQQNGFPTGLEGLMFGGGYSTQNRVPQSYTITYYPGAASENSAAPIDVQSGADLRGIDLVVSAQQSYRVRGRVTDSRTGQPPQSASISMTPQVRDVNDLIFSGGAGNSNYKPADGSFEFQNVGAGVYALNASIPNAPQTRAVDFNSMSPAERNEYFQAMQAQDLVLPKASLPINVINADVDGVVLALGLSSSVSGRVRVESTAPDAAASLDFIRLQLKGGTPVTPLDSGPQSRPVKEDGTFRVDNVWPGEYRVSIAGLPQGFYVKEARAGEADLLNQPLRVTGPNSNPLDILISPKVGTLDGVAVDAAGQPSPGAQVVLIPARNRERTELFRPVMADSTGHFDIPGVAPGEYILAAWEAIEPNAFFDPNLILQAEAQGKAVRVAESSSQAVNVMSIPPR